MALLTVENLSFCYPGANTPAISDISLEIEEGEFVLLCGPSGCGKTSLIRSFKPQLAPFGEQSGRIWYDGTLIEDLEERRSAGEIGFVMQNPENQVVTDRVWHEIAFGMENLGLPSEAIRLRTAEMASFFGISGWFHQRTAELSGGQKQLLNLAAVMAMQPRLLLLDEPTSQLDPIAASEFLETIHKLNRDTGLTVLLAEHRLEEACSMADRVLVMERGKLLLAVNPRETAKCLHTMGRSDLLAGFPAAVRVYHGLDCGGECPLTVREGRRYLYRCAPCRRFDRVECRETAPIGIPALEAKHVSFRYSRDGADILKDLNFQAYSGEITAVLGANGSGKSTLLSLFSGLRKPYEGRCFVEGKPLSSYRGNDLYCKKLAALPQNPQTLFVRDRLREDLEDMAAQLGWKGEERSARVMQVAKRVGLESLLERHPYDLSGGEQQRAALAKLLLCEPEILLLDEPTKGVDGDAKRDLAAILNQLKGEGAAILLVTHDVEFAAEYADRCALLFDGGVVSQGPPHHFFPNNSFYTTAANRMSRKLYQNAITSEDVIALCRRNMEPQAGED